MSGGDREPGLGCQSRNPLNEENGPGEPGGSLLTS